MLTTVKRKRGGFMSKKFLLIFFTVFMSIALLGSVYAADAPGFTSNVDLKLNGVYNVWTLSQNKFFFGSKGSDFEEDNYIVQMLRFRTVLSDKNEDIKVVTRFDFAQGWWGADNAGDQAFDGGQFFDKNTFFDVHVDHAYIDFRIPTTVSRFAAGRMHFNLGNKLVLDDDLDAFKLTVPAGKGKINLAYAKFFEGDPGGTKSEPLPSNINASFNPTLGSLNDAGSVDDANMYLASYTMGKKVSGWVVYYDDAGYKDGTAYITNGLGYHRPRFTPQVSNLIIVGANGKLDIGNVSLNVEADYLTGEDNVPNTTYNTGANDINNGDISGYTAYVDAKYNVKKGTNVGLKVGYGSGDDDVTGGDGNITKLKTQGFFYITEVWEDSIMPDVAGITPQGIGAPNTRGYREFENTTALHVYTNVAVNNWLNLFGSYSYLMATEDVNGWASTGTDIVPTSERADDIGNEFDFIASAKIYKNLKFQFRAGYFIPGDAALLQVNGNTANDDDAWEIKNTLTYKF